MHACEKQMMYFKGNSRLENFHLYRNSAFKIQSKKEGVINSRGLPYIQCLFRYCAVPRMHNSQFTFHITYWCGLQSEDMSTAHDVWINKGH